MTGISLNFIVVNLLTNFALKCYKNNQVTKTRIAKRHQVHNSRTEFVEISFIILKSGIIFSEVCTGLAFLSLSSCCFSFNHKHRFY